MAAYICNKSTSATWLAGSAFTVLTLPLIFWGAQPLQLPLTGDRTQGRLDDFALQYLGAAAAISLGCGALRLCGGGGQAKDASQAQPSTPLLATLQGSSASANLQLSPSATEISEDYLATSGLGSFLDADDAPITVPLRTSPLQAASPSPAPAQLTSQHGNQVGGAPSHAWQSTPACDPIQFQSALPANAAPNVSAPHAEPMSWAQSVAQRNALSQSGCIQQVGVVTQAVAQRMSPPMLAPNAIAQGQPQRPQAFQQPWTERPTSANNQATAKPTATHHANSGPIPYAQLATLHEFPPRSNSEPSAAIAAPPNPSPSTGHPHVACGPVIPELCPSPGVRDSAQDPRR